MREKQKIESAFHFLKPSILTSTGKDFTLLFPRKPQFNKTKKSIPRFIHTAPNQGTVQLAFIKYIKHEKECFIRLFKHPDESSKHNKQQRFH